MYFPRDEYETRWGAVHDVMRARGIDLAIVWGRGAGTHERCGNVLYLSNYYSSQPAHEEDGPGWSGVGFSAVVLRLGHEPTLVCDMPGPVDLAVADVVSHDDVIAKAAEVVGALSSDGTVALVGYEFLPAKYYDAFVAAVPHLEVVPADDLLAGPRRHKSARELECMREAGRNATHAMTAMIEAAIPGDVSHADVAAAGAAELVRRGGVPHVSVASGPDMVRWTSDPLTGASTSARIGHGDMTRLWLYGPMWQGYWLDPGRTFVAGAKPTARQREVIEIGTSIVEQLTAAIRPGAKIGDIVRLGMKLRQESGTSEDQASTAWPVFGHGTGLFWDAPSIDESHLQTGDVFLLDDTLGVEVFLHWPDVGSVGFENNVIVGPDRCENITPVETRWW